MTLVYLVVGLLITGFVFEYSRKIGAMLLVVLVLGAWLAAHKKGVI